MARWQMLRGPRAAGGRVTGVIPRALVEREIAPQPDATHRSEWHARAQKAEMARRANAFLVLPGGLGTLDEMCEILTWAQHGIHDKPVVLIKIAGYWNAFLGMLDAPVGAGFMRSAHRGLSVVPDVRAACDTVARFWHDGAKLYPANIRP
jgi:uncharacterized protein (TIGR00730 family)